MNKIRTFGKRTLAVLSACMIPLTGLFTSAPLVANAADNYVYPDTTKSSLNISDTKSIQIDGRSIAKNIDGTTSYTYTGKIYPANSSIYDYLSDREIYGLSRESEVSGYGDSYTRLNDAISGQLISPSSENLTIKYYDDVGTNKNICVYLYNSKSNQNNGWRGKRMAKVGTENDYVYTVKYSDLGFQPDSIIITGENESGSQWEGSILSYKVNGSAQVLTKGNSYKIKNDVVSLDSHKADDIYNRNSSYDIPLYFGCFYREYELFNDTGDNYWASNKGDGDYKGIKNYDFYDKFYWQSNISLRGDYAASVQGLVDNTLTDGTISQKGVKLPYFNDDWADAHSDMVKYWHDVSFPFYEVDIAADTVHNTSGSSATGIAKYYQFNSKENNLLLDTDRGLYKETTTQILSQKTVVRDKNNHSIILSTDTRTPCYLPFNDHDDAKDNNLGFGTAIDIKFYLREDGKVETVDKQGKGTGTYVPATFEFMGDDDVWVFIDDKLVLDLGGDHKDTTGIIDFAEGVAIANDAFTFGDVNRDDVHKERGGRSKTVKKKNIISDAFEGNKYKENVEHTLRMFYMERGMYESDLFVRFNFSATPNNNTLKIKEITQFKDINAGLLELTQKAADYDVFDYSISNSGTSADDVGESGILSPTYNYYQRDNLGQKALLSGKDIEYDLVYDNDSIYLDTSKVLSGGHTWDYDTVLAAWIWKDGDDSSSRLYLAQQVDEHLYKFSGFSSDANKVVFCRLHADQSYTDGSSSWPGDGNVYDKAELGFENSYIYVVNDWKNNISKGSRATKQEVHYETHDFDPTQGNAVKNVNYIWTDDTAKIIKNTDTNDLVGTTDGSGSFRLMYGTNENESSAEFQRQFKKGSQMTVNQNDLMKTVERTDVENTPETFGTTKSRSASKYYDTTVTVVDNEGGIIIPETATSKTSYEYSNNNPDSKNPVQITETFVNTPKVGAITVTKNLDPNDNVTDEFEFTIRLYDIFGVSGIEVEDYSLISANKTIGSDGTFILTRDETLVIQGIPYGTKYTVTENPVKNYNLKETSAEGEKIVYEGTFDDESGINIDDANKETVINTRKTNSLTLSKALAGDYSDTDVDEDTPFEFTVNFTAPEGVTLSDYKFKVDGREITGTSSITINVSAKQSVTISGIPYGTGYTVSEALSMVNWSNSGDETGTIGETPSTAVITNTYTKPAVGNLEITKNVLTSTGSDEIEDSDKALVFEFTVTLTDISGAALTTDDTYNMTKTSSAGVSDDMLTFEKGVATVTLSDDESVLIEGIPAGYHYTVTESYMAGFTPSSTNAESAIVKDTTVTAEFTNTKIFQPYELPDAGFEDSRMYFVFMLSGMFMFGIAYWYINRSKAKR